MRFISFEGVDGCGKTTQAKRLHQELSRRLAPARQVLLVQDPGGTSIGDRLRTVLLDPASTGMCVETEVLLYFASRAQLVTERIRPAIGRGDLVISDRFFDATAAYQGSGRGVDIGALDRLQRFAAGDLMPDLTLLLDLEPEAGRARIHEKRNATGAAPADRMEREAIEFARRVRAGYLSLAAREPSRFRVLDASGTPDEMARRISAEIDAHGL